MNEFIPPVDEQAEEILRDLRADTRIDLAPSITAAEIERSIDPEAPTSVNFKTVLEALR